MSDIRLKRDSFLNIAAVVLGLISVAAYFLFFRAGEAPETPAHPNGGSVPSANKAVLPVLFVYYLLTMLALGLFVWRLVRPGAPIWHVYLVASLGCIAGLWLNHMLQALPKDPSMPVKLNPGWAIATPNLVLLILLLVYDAWMWRSKRQ